MLTRATTIILAAGIAIAGVVLWRAAASSSMNLARRMRWALALLAAYGVAGFLQATLNGISLRAALGGQGVFHFLPHILQGSFLGGFLILPLAWIASVVRLGFPRFRDGSLRSHLYQAIALTTCVAIVVTSFTYGTSGPDSTKEDPKARAAEFDKSLRALEDGDRDMPRDTWDPDYIVTMVGRDPTALFRWVQQNTYWIPYRGALRGAAGVLMDRQGNSLDRALLLATLLEKLGITVRLAHGELSAEQADRLLPELVAYREIAFHVQGKPDLDNLHLASEKYGLDNSSIQQSLSAAQQQIAELYSELRSHVKGQSERLLQVVKRPKQAAEWFQRSESALNALRDHWWVQQQSGDEWIDLDLLQRPKAAGALVQAEDTTSIADLSSELRHEIILRVISEQASRGKLRQHKTFESVLRLTDLLGRPVVLQFWPEDWVSNSGQTRVRTAFRHAALEQQTWGAALEVGTKTIASGILSANGDDPKAAQDDGDLGGIAGAFSRTMGVSQEDPNRQLSAVWIEYEIRVPGEKTQVVRRNVFDLVGTAARASGTPSIALTDANRLTRSLALMMRTEILPISCRFSPEFLAHLAAQSLTGNHELINAAIRGELMPDTSASDALLDHMVPMVSTLYTLAEARFEWGSDPDSMFVDRPQLLSNHSYAATERDAIVPREATDIVANEFGVSLSVADGFLARLTQGVLDTNAEAMFPVRMDGFGNAAEAYKKSGAWAYVADAGQTGNLQLPPDSLRGISDDVSSGFDVVAPRSSIPMAHENFSGWWRIDRNSGTTLGMGTNGWGDAEYSVQTNRAASQEPVWVRMFNGAREGFISGYSWCVAINAYEQVRQDKIVIQERVTARIMSDQRECAKEGLYGAVIGGIVSAVLPLFIATMGPILSKWLTRVFPAAGPKIVQGAKTVGNFLAGEGPALGNGGNPEGNPKPPTRSNPKRPSRAPPNESNANPSNDSESKPPKKNPCDEPSSQTVPAEDVVEPTPPDSRGLQAPMDSLEQIDQKLKDLAVAEPNAESFRKAAADAVERATDQEILATQNYNAARAKAERVLGENYYHDPEVVTAGARKAEAELNLGNAKQVLFNAERDLSKLLTQQAHYRTIQSPTARLIQAQEQFELVLQQGESLRQMEAAAASATCGADSGLAAEIAAYNKEAASITKEFKAAQDAYWDAFFDETTPYESSPTQADRYGAAGQTGTQPGYPNGSPGTPGVGPGQAPPLPSQPQASVPQGQGAPAGQSSAANSIPPPPPNPMANSMVGAGGALNAVGGPR
jgi:hypothetical protein